MRLFLPLALLAPAPAVAAERTVPIASFERVRVNAPVIVTVEHGPTARARIEGPAAALETIALEAAGTTLTVRLREGAALPAARGPVRVTLTTPVLRGAAVRGGGALTLAQVGAAARLDLALDGSGALVARAIDAGELVVTLVGAGSITLDGKAQRARYLRTGAGKLDAERLAADDLIVRSDGAGAVTARARYSADIGALGLGPVTVIGGAKCKIASSAALVRCGVADATGAPAR